MKLDFLYKNQDNSRLILIFAGWSAGAEIGERVMIPGWDVAVVHDFTTLDLETDFLRHYYTIYVFAWSLGVVAAELLLPAERITSAFALNGTPVPVDDQYGIPENIYDGTAESLNETNLRKFRMRMAGNREVYETLPILTDINIDNLKQQLYNIRVAVKNHHTLLKPRLPWVRAYLSKSDRIFPPDNMLRFWNQAEDVQIIDEEGNHYVPIEIIVKSVIADTSKVSERFSKASISYDTHAIAQYSIALRLADRLKSRLSGKIKSLLEIGCGTGLFTKEYSRFLRPEAATFVDITNTGPFEIADTETYVVEDAERWIEKDSAEYDMILSASAIQWFADIPRFLHLCHQRLKDNGIIAISTFAPGNMEELDELRPSPLLYPKASVLRALMEKEYREVRVEEDEIKVEFQSIREMMMHLKYTGVGGSAPESGRSVKEMSHLRSLTYRPIFITAKK